MNSKDFFDLIIDLFKYVTGTGKLTHIRNGLRLLNKLPNYNDDVTPDGAAWLIYCIAFCPSSTREQVAEWVKKKEKFFNKVKNNPIKLLSIALGDKTGAAEIAMIYFTVGLDAFQIAWRGEGEKKFFPEETENPIDYTEFLQKPISVMQIPGASLEKIAMALEVAKIKTEKV